MPKKFNGENSKAAAARARKDAIKQEAKAKKKQEEEDAYWRDDDKTNARKLQRKEEAERKRQEALQRKMENRLAHDAEMEQLSRKSAPSTKVTQAAIEANLRAEAKRREEEERREKLLKESRIEELKTDDIEENINHVKIEGEVARSVTEAIQVLSDGQQAVDHHPEKRLKAAYAAFEEKMMPRLKEQHPTFRLSQLRQVLKKEWQKSPENPLNQKILDIIK
uniref:Coiled-coil domain-containing protein 124 n=1 Tax=Syphacia muris TaxID=451379 RepID=A0A0N5AWM2_9BILA